MTSETKNVDKINVSDLFLDIYSNFNVNSQVEKMKELSKKELYLLIVTILDRFSNEDLMVIHNMKPFKTEAMIIYDLQDDKEIDDVDVLSLIEETHDKYIDTGNIYHNDEKLPEPLDKSGVRDAKIDLIVKKNG